MENGEIGMFESDQEEGIKKYSFDLGTQKCTLLCNFFELIVVFAT